MTTRSSESEGDRAYLQRRVALLGKSMTVVALVGVGIHLLTLLTPRSHDDWVYFIFITPTIGAVLWRAGSRGEYTSHVLHGMSFASLFLSMLVTSVQGRLMLPSTLGDLGGTLVEQSSVPVLSLVQAFMSMSILFGSALMVALRAAIIPSSRQRTVVVTLLLGVPIIVITTFGAPPFERASLFMTRLGPEDLGTTLIGGVIWWGITTYVCSMITNIVHGLRTQARAAQRLGQYTLEEKIGEGGMGVVYRATHALLRRETAIKLLSPEKSGDINLKRFEQEVRLTARLTHPNTVTIYDYGHTPDGLFYYAMELLDGATLEEIVDMNGSMPMGRVLHILEELLGALTEAHGIGLIHRDIKPSNVILCSRGGRADVTKLVDFGLVKDLVEPFEAGLTQPDIIIGTPLYLAPEVVTTPEDVGVRSDLYAVGALGYYLITGQHVFTGRSMAEIIGHHLHTVPESLSVKRGAAVPQDIEDLVLRCLAKQPEKRPASATVVLQELAQCDACGQWTDEDARAWWQQHADALKLRKATLSFTPGPMTMKIA